ncbi:MAG: hypothetical protein JJW00_00200 [Sulfurimonas sp.]|nr:hypothetical protein [Sulfurimonas sp.]
MTQKEELESIQKALEVSPKTASSLMDGKKDIYKFRKANPKIYRYVLIGIAIERSGMNIRQMRQAIETYKVFSKKEEDTNE